MSHFASQPSVGSKAEYRDAMAYDLTDLELFLQVVDLDNITLTNRSGSGHRDRRLLTEVITAMLQHQTGGLSPRLRVVFARLTRLPAPRKEVRLS